MSKQNKWVGGQGGKIGKSAYAAQSAAQYSHMSPSSGSSSKSNYTKGASGFGDTAANSTATISSSQNTNRFMSTIQSGQYQGGSKQPMLKSYQSKDTGAKSKFDSPTKSSHGKTGGAKKEQAPSHNRPNTSNMMKNDGSGKLMNKSKTMNNLVKGLRSK